jgi:prolyl oligopeptidase
MPGFAYPPAHTVDQVDDYHGTKVRDPYRWLENPDSPESQAFIAAQNQLTEDFLSESPSREQWRARLTEVWDFPKYTLPQRRGSHYFFQQNDGLQNQAVMYRMESLDGDLIEVLDPNTLSDDGTVALVNWSFTKDGQRMAYTLSASGSDQQEIHILNVTRKETYSEVLKWCRFTSIAWLPDGSGFYYNRYPEPGTVGKEDLQAYNRLYFHQIHTPQSADQLVYERPDAKELNFQPIITDDEQYLVLYVWHGAINRNRIYYRPLQSSGDFVRLMDEADAEYLFLGNSGSTFYFQTDLDAPKGRVIGVDVNRPEREHWQTVIPEGDDTFSFVSMVNQQFVVVTLRDAAHRMHLYHLDGTHDREIVLPTLGSIEGISGKQTDTEMFFSFTSFLYPSTVFRYDFPTGKLEVFRQPKLKVNTDDYITRQVFYTSKDGTRVPMFLTHRGSLEANGKIPVLLYGYGGYSINMSPWFAAYALPWVEQGGIFAVACLRGGAEYGEDWHQAGMLDKKQNVFDDFIAAGEWFIQNGYTTPKRLAIMGGSNGGLLVAACMLQRPDLFGGVICNVPVLDMLRYHKFTAGRYWTPEYGNAEENPEHFQFLYAYSPLHNVKPGEKYPPVLIHTAESDDRVVPLHAMKFAATLQTLAPSDNPILLQIETKAGHGLGKPTSKLIAQYTDFFAFLWQVFQMDSPPYG